MADVSPAFDQLLRQHDSALHRKPWSPDQADSFLREAYRINLLILRLHRELRDIRQAYLSTVRSRSSRVQRAPSPHLTDREREEIDATAKRSIRELNASIRDLDEAEKLRRDTERVLLRKKHGRGLGLLGSWAAGSSGSGTREGKTNEHAAAEERANELGMHRNGVILFLKEHLELCCRTQQEMMEKRLTREMEKNRSILAKTAGPSIPWQTMPGALGSGARSPELDECAYATSQGLSIDQVQMFEKGNQDMMQHMENEMDKIRTAQKSLFEISELQNTLMSNLSMQREQVDLLTIDQQSTEGNVRGGNRELAKAAKRPSAAKYTFYAAGILCAFLISWDLVI